MRSVYQQQTNSTFVVKFNLKLATCLWNFTSLFEKLHQEEITFYAIEKVSKYAAKHGYKHVVVSNIDDQVKSKLNGSEVDSLFRDVGEKKYISSV